MLCNWFQRRRLELNPMDVDAQRKLEDLIRLQNVESNRQLALEHTPEVFFRYVLCPVCCAQCAVFSVLCPVCCG